jgi:hypothetical protein
MNYNYIVGRAAVATAVVAAATHPTTVWRLLTIRISRVVGPALKKMYS